MLGSRPSPFGSRPSPLRAAQPGGTAGSRDGFVPVPPTAWQLAACRDLGRRDPNHRRLHRARPDPGAQDNGDGSFVTLIDTLTKCERTLANTGRADVVLESRGAFQTAMR